MIIQEPSGFTVNSTICSKIEATHHVFRSEFIRQTVESLDSPGLTLHIHRGLAILIVEISLGHRPEIVTLAGVLDVDDQLG